MSTLSTNPNTLLGYGTWVALGAGRVLVSVGTGTDVNGVMKTFTAAQVGGEYEHVQTDVEVGKHRHPLWRGTNEQLGGGNTRVDPNMLGTQDTFTDYNHSAAATAMQWMPPYLALYMWERTA